MKKLFLFIILFFLHPKDYINANQLNDTCSLNFKEIYDFSIGDIFQDESSIITWGVKQTDEGEDNYIIRKYRIDDKVVKGDSITYWISGRYYRYTAYGTGYILYEEYGDIETEINYLDSADHFLNQVDSSLVPFDYASLMALENIYTYMIRFTQNSIDKKILGDYNNLYQYSTDSSLIPVNYCYAFEIYGRELGLLEQEFTTEDTYSYYLLGCVKNGDTTGIIWPDSNFYVGIDLSMDNSAINIYPNPSNNIISISPFSLIVPGSSINFYDLYGKLLLSKRIDTPEIQINELKKGIYLYSIINGDKKIYRGKILKK